MVSRTPPIRPIQFSALKSLDPLQNEVEHAEHHDGQADIDHVGHGSPPRETSAWPPVCRPDTSEIPGKRPTRSRPCAFHAAPWRPLTEPMRPGPLSTRHAGGKPGLNRQSVPRQAVRPRTPTSYSRPSRSAGSEYTRYAPARSSSSRP